MSRPFDPVILLAALLLGTIVLRVAFAYIRRVRLSQRQREYREYLRTETWKRLRRDALERDGRRCRLCNARDDLQVHHRYYPETLGTETADALTTLCRRCHDQVAHQIERGATWLPLFGRFH